MGSHSNPVIQQHVDSTQDLVTKMNTLKTSLSTSIAEQFINDMGVSIPSVIEADVRILDYALVYSSDPTVDEYLAGAQGVLNASIAGDYPSVANKALDLVTVVASKIIGSGTVGIGLQSDSAKITDSQSHKTFISACYSLVEQCSSTDWNTSQNFYVSYYVFLVWEPEASAVKDIKTAKTLEI
ncbi:hypothetical protein LC607_10905 [Nostoc sp. CHAB 5824]|nr:hypothetical protein [Nostoc sp. CHAB 5824]